MKIRDWLSHLIRPYPSALQYGVTIAKFKDDPGRVRAMGDIWKHPTFQYALGVLALSAPPHAATYQDPTATAYDLGVAKGVRDSIAMLKHLSEPEVEYEDIKPTWGVPEENESEIPTA